MPRLINAVLFQAVWFICLLAGSVWALVATAVYLFLHDRYFMRTRREWRLIGAFLALGILIDGAFFQLELFSFSANITGQNSFPPVWLLCLWASVATLFAHSLVFLRSRYLLTAIMGAIGPTLSYFAGANLAGITLASPIWLSLLVVAFVWSMVLPFGLFLAERWALFQK